MSMIDDLQILHEKSTPGTWRGVGFVVEGIRPVRDLCEPGQSIRPETVIRVGRLTSKENSEEDEANRDLIALMHNALPALLAVVRAAVEIEENTPGYSGALSRAVDALKKETITL